MLITTAAFAALSRGGKRNSGSAYIETGILDSFGNTDLSFYSAPKSPLKKIFGSSFAKWTKRTISGFAAAFLFVISIFAVGQNFYGYDIISAWADDEFSEQWDEGLSDVSSDLSSSASSGEGASQSDPSTWGPLRTFVPTSEPGPSIGYVVWRMAFPGYLNNVEMAVAPWGDPENARVGGVQGSDWMCRGTGFSNNPNPIYGTPLYHNCDVPNLSAQLLQWVIGSIGDQGVRNASLQDARTTFGVPNESLLPGGNVPVNLEASDQKYTALERYGYNLNYTSYVGEWDDISVMMEARALTNFSVWDNLSMRTQSIINGIAGAFEGGVTGAIDAGSGAWDAAVEGQYWRFATLPFETMFGFFTGSFSGFAANSIRTYIDTSDYNVFNTGSWYRRTYPETIYGNVRQMTDEEMSEMMARQQQVRMLNAWWETLEEFQAEGFEELDNIDGSSAPFTSYEGEHGLPVISNEELRSIHEENMDAYRAELSSYNAYNRDVRAYNNLSEEEREDEDRPVRSDYDPDAPSQRPEEPEEPWDYETFDEWISAYPSVFNAAVNQDHAPGQFQECINNYTEDGGTSASFQTCWQAAWESALASLIEENADELWEDFIQNYYGSVFGAMGSFILGENANFNPEEDMELPPNHPYNRYVCEDSNGQIWRDPPQNTDVMRLYANPNSSETNHNREGYNCPVAIRPPIQDGLFGSGYSDSWASETNRQIPGEDTRRENFNGWRAVGADPLFAVMNGYSGFMLNVAIWTTQLSNFFIDMSFNPPLRWIGFDEIVVNLVESFRDSMFFPLATLVIAIGAIALFLKHARRHEYRQGFVSLGMMFVVAVSGVFIMNDPDRLVQFSDDIPSVVENTFAAAVFSAMASEDELLCSSDGTVSPGQGTEYGADSTVFEGDSFGPALTIRTMMCENWRNFAFNPWVYGQFGVGYSELNNSRMQNDNSDLVGNANVNLGGGSSVNNWAIYQLEATTSGTITDYDSSRGVGHTDPDIYRLVDLQAGPLNAEASDTRYFGRWASDDFGNMQARATDATMGAITSLFGLAAVFLYVLIKLEYTLFVTLLLIIMPIMFLIGLEPTRGRATLRKYFGSLFGAMAKRVMAVFFLAMMFALMTLSTVGHTGGYFHVAVILMIISLAFIMNRKRFMSMIEDAGNKVGNGTIGQDGARMPLFGKMFHKEGADLLKNTVGATVGGAAMGGIRSGMSGAKSSVKDSIGATKHALNTAEEEGSSKTKALLQGIGKGAARTTGDALKYSALGTYQGGKTRGEAVIRRTMQIHRGSSSGLGFIGRAVNLNGELSDSFTKRTNLPKYNQAARDMEDENLTQKIDMKSAERDDAEALKDKLRNSNTPEEYSQEIGNLESAIENAEREIKELVQKRDRAKFAKDWNSKESDINWSKSSAQRELHRKYKDSKKIARESKNNKGYVSPDSRTSNSTLFDFDGSGENYTKDSLDESYRVRERQREVMERIAELDKQKAKIREESRREFLDDKVSQNLPEGKSLDSLKKEDLKYNQAIENAEKELSSRDMKTIEKIASDRISENGLNDDRYIYDHEKYTRPVKQEETSSVEDGKGNKLSEMKDSPVSINEAIRDSHSRGFEADMVEKKTVFNPDGSSVQKAASSNERITRIRDKATGASAEIITNKNGSSNILVFDEKNNLSGGKMTADNSVNEAFEKAYKEMGKISAAQKVKDTEGFSTDAVNSAKSAYQFHDEDFGNRKYRVHEIPKWSREEIERIDNQIERLGEILKEDGGSSDSHKVRQRISKLEDKKEEVRRVEKRAKAQDKELSYEYYGGSKEETKSSQYHGTNLGQAASVGLNAAPLPIPRPVKSMKAAVRFENDFKRRHSNKKSRDFFTKSAKEGYDTNTKKTISKIKKSSKYNESFKNHQKKWNES